MANSKRCIKCLVERDVSEFGKDRRRPDGLFPYCKPCRLVKNPEDRRCKTVEEALSKYKISKSGCWEWQGTLLINEFYGVVCFQGKRYRAHRLSYSHHVGEIPEGKIVCHHCDNPKCINPDHLYAGTNQDNSNDMVSRGRHVSKKGESSEKSKLKEWQIPIIRADKRKEKDIAKAFGVAPSTIGHVRRRISWGHIK